MNSSKQSIGSLVTILIISILAAFIMVGLDRDGTVWLKFLLYLMLFLGITAPAWFYNKSCTAWLGHLLKRKRS